MKKFSSEFIEQVRQANDIVSVVSEYVSLKQQGRNFWACCPFHHEKTASFSVAADKGFFYCFGCHAAGDVFAFIMKQENLSFTEAVTRLAERAHISLPKTEQSPQETARQNLCRRFFEINEMAGNFFHNCLLQSSLGKEGLAYFHSRHVSDDTIRAFKLGFAPDSWHMLTKAFQQRGVSGAELVRLGLAKEKNGNFYDAFRKRVIFPIRDGRGRIVGFGGRVLDDSKPKYLNSPETPIFNKRHILFALDMAQPAIYKEGCAILVEGYMDVVSAHNRGITNVVASLGTAFTTEQARLLQRQAAQLVLAYDMDAAGRQATMRAMEIVRGLHVSIRVLSLGQGKDPDEYITTVGPDAFRQAVAAAPNTLDYMLQTALQTYDSTVPEGKSAIMASIMPAVARIDDRIVLEAFLTKAAQRLQVEETAVRSEFNRFVERHPELKQGKLVITPHLERRLADSRGTDVMAAAEENILRYLMEYPHNCERIQEMIPYTLFVNPLRQHIYQFILDAYAEKRTYTKADIQDRLSVEEEKELARIMVLQDVPLDERVLNDYVKRFHLAGLQRQYAEHSKRAAAFSRTGDPQVMKELAICKEINEKIRKWSCRGERS